MAEMTPAEREAYERWQRSHTPGRAADRKRKQAAKRQAIDIAALLARPAEASDEVAAIDREIAQLKAKQERLHR